MAKEARLSEWHRLVEIDVETHTGMCSICGPVKVKSKGRSVQGKVLWRCVNRR